VSDRARVLVVDDDAAFIQTVTRGLVKRGFDVVAETQGPTALEHVAREDFDAVLTDLSMHPISGTEICERVRALRPDVPVLVLTAFGSMEAAVAALRSGAYDFLSKPIDLDVAQHALSRAVETRRLRGELRRLKQGGAERAAFSDLVGESPAMQRLCDTIARIADSDATVLLTGESGVGKELVARALHEHGARREGRFVAVDCAAIPAPLLESELFGHAKGAFTDARMARTGLFTQSDGGTLFLDEIGEMPLEMQAKLLRALQERKVRPLGEEREHSFDARVIAATNRDLLDAVERGTFREDLYFRLAVIEIEVPPLRSRGTDVLSIAHRLLERAASRTGRNVRGFDPEAARHLVRYRWPGNVRELANCIEHAVAMARFDHITAADLPPRISEFSPGSDVLIASDDPEALVPLEEVERRYVLRVLDAANGRRGKAAKILGLDRKTLYRKLERWGAPASEEEND
jgi:DNA-binding NtrC family response regulator